MLWTAGGGRGRSNAVEVMEVCIIGILSVFSLSMLIERDSGEGGRLSVHGGCGGGEKKVLSHLGIACAVLANRRRRFVGETNPL